MYTELFVEGTLNTRAPKEVERVVRLLFDCDYPASGQPLSLPDHEFFRKPRWTSIGNSSSFYHIPMKLSGIRKNHTGKLSFVSRSDLKNYDDEIESFIDWITPYCERIRGWSWYEEDDAPTIFHAEAME